MENYEEIYNVIRKWFEESLKISIKIPEDLSDGCYYLQLLKRCVDLEITNSARKNFEIIENVLNNYFGFQTNCVVDYIEFVEHNPSDDNIISLCIFCFVLCEQCHQTPKGLTKDDFKRLVYLTAPLMQLDKQHPTPAMFRVVIDKAKERELDDLSLSSGSIAPFAKSRNESGKDDDDDISNSSCIRSFISESSFNAKSTRDSMNDSASHDRHKMLALKKQYKISKPRRNQNFLSTACRRSMNSPKLNESRKLEQRYLKTLELDNHSIKQENLQLNDDVQKLIESEKKLNNEVCKLRVDNRRLMDDVDCLNTTIEDNAKTIMRKDKEFEKIKKELELVKKLVADKLDDIKQLQLSNDKLQHDAHILNNKLKTRSSQCEESMKNEVDICQEKRILQDENTQLKTIVEELQKKWNDAQNAKSRFIERDVLLESPVSNIEVGESLDIINEFKLAEMMKDFEEKKISWEKEMIQLKSELKIEKENSDNVSTNRQEIFFRLNEASEKLENCQSKLMDSEEEIKRLTKHNQNLKLEVESDKGRMDKVIEESNVEQIIELFGNLFPSKEFSYEDKNRLLKSFAQALGIDFSRLERNHDLCQTEISSLYQKLQNTKEKISEKDLYIHNMNNVLSETEQQLYTIKQDLANAQSENEEMSRLWQSQKSKSDETEFKLKKTLFSVEEERREACSQNKILKRDLVVRESELRKSNEEFNILRSRYDECLLSLHNLSEDCKVYERVIIDATESQKKTFRNALSQTDAANNSFYFNTTPNGKMTSVMDRGDSYRRGVVREMPSNNRLDESFHKKRNNEVSLIARLSRNAMDSRIDNNDYQHTINSYRKASPIVNKFGNSECINSSYCSTEYGNRQILDPKWVESVKGRVDKSVVDNRKVYSPSVKPARLHQMISRNLQQPDHLKSSYPVETQALDQGYLAHVLIEGIDLEDDLSSDAHVPEPTTRLSARHYTQNDHMNLRGNNNNHGTYNCHENSFSDNLIKASYSNGLTPRNMVLSARSNNQTTPRSEVFKLPLALPTTRSDHVDRNWVRDRENVIPFNNHTNVPSDRASESSAPIKFEILNSPKRKPRPKTKLFAKV